MPKKLKGITNGTYRLEETKVENQLNFFRNDHGVLGNVGTIPIEMFSRYLIRKVKEGKFDEEFVGEIYFELSEDRKVLRLTICEHVKSNLFIIKSEKG